MGITPQSAKNTISELSKKKFSLSSRLALAFGILAIGAGYFAYTFYVSNQEAQSQIKSLNSQVIDLNLKIAQNLDLEQRLTASESANSTLNNDLTENKALLLQASEALEKCTPRAAKKSAITAPAQK